MVHEHHFEFVPIARASGWSISAGEPRIWWWGRLDEETQLLLSDGMDARKLDVGITVSVGTETSSGKTLDGREGHEGVAVWGFISCMVNPYLLSVSIAVSKDNFDHILTAVQTVGPPTVYVGTDALRRTSTRVRRAASQKLNCLRIHSVSTSTALMRTPQQTQITANAGITRIPSHYSL